MALTLANRVRETTTTTGTGTVTLAGAVTGYQSFSVIGNANTTYYTISGQGTSEFEVGIGTYTLSGTTLSRDTVLASSNAGSAVNFSAGTKDVFVTYPSNKAVYLDASGNASALGTPASGTVTNLTGTASININGTVGATTATTGAFTTGAFSGQITSTVGNSGIVLYNHSATTGYIIASDIQNTGSRHVIGIDNSTGNSGLLSSGSSAYATVISTQDNHPVIIGVNASLIGTFSSTGLAVTGTGTFSGAASSKTMLSVGSGSSTSQGWHFGNHSSGAGGMWPTDVTPSASNYTFLGHSGVTYVNAGTTVSINVANNGVLAATASGVAVTGTVDATGTITSTQAGTGIKAKNDTGAIAVYNTANAGIIYLSTVKGWVGSGANVTDGALGTVGDMYLYGNASATATAKLTSTGLAVTGALSATGVASLGTAATGLSYETTVSYVELKYGNSIGSGNYGTNTLQLNNNSYQDSGGYKFGGTGYAQMYFMTGGSHNWRVSSASGTLGNAITYRTIGATDTTGNWTFSPAGNTAAVISTTGMAVTGTLTASGTAAIGSTSFSGSQLYVTGTFGATAGITDAAIEVYVNDDGSTPKSGDRIGIKSVLYNVGRTTGKTVGLYTDVSEIDTNICYGTYSKAAGTYLQQYAVYGEVSKNLAAYTAGYCFYGKATTTSSGGQVYFLAGDDNGTTRILAGQNGGLSNYQANDVNLSDRREKKDFAPAKSYLDVICAIPVQTFRYIDQKDDDLNLGVIAQDVQAVAPELVTESDWAAPDQEAKVRLAVYQTDLQFALMKAIQELAAKVAKLEAV